MKRKTNYSYFQIFRILLYCSESHRTPATGHLPPDTRKNLFGNREGVKTITLVKANESTSQLHQGQIALGELFPAHQQPPEVIEPGNQPFDHPAARLLARLLLLTGSQLLGGGGMTMVTVPPVGPHMRHVAKLLDRLDDSW